MTGEEKKAFGEFLLKKADENIEHLERTLKQALERLREIINLYDLNKQ